MIPLFKLLRDLDIKLEGNEVKAVPRGEENRKQREIAYQLELDFKEIKHQES
ncbi:hypothetical protein V7138_22825 [Bacillus sp. JJ1533]|uniref:hypothetical protein n=1 Tax=Bacillus sp. JJ1533 TaxID=3122959 RepID=UPI002FFF4EF9